MKGFLIFLCFVGFLLADCYFTYDCQHGYCQNGQCQCNTDYIGDDCSIYSHPMEENELVSGDVKEKAWRYYPLDTTKVETITWTLTTHSAQDFCSVYVNLDDYPSEIQYVAKNSSGKTLETVVVTAAETGKWIAGVWGVTACTYEIRADFSPPCSPECGEHGSCTTQQTCKCNDGYVGETCDVPEVQPNHQYTGFSPDLGTWTYFAFQADQFYESLEWEVTAIDSQKNKCELFTRTDEAPDLFDFDETTIGFSNDPVSLEVTEVEEGHTYFFSVTGLFGYSGCNFSLTLHANLPSSQTECPNKCSQHALSETCENNICDCNTSYTGENCEEYTPSIVIGEKYKGYVGSGAWNYYHLDAQTENTLIVTLKLTSDNGSLNLFIKDGAKPTLYNYTYSNTSSESEMELALEQPVGYRWYFGIFADDAAAYSLKVTETTKCPCVDSHHGSCSDNEEEVCVCNPPYVGEDCGSEVRTLVSGQSVTNEVVEKDKWKYYSISVQNKSAASLTVKEHDEVGVTWVFIGFNGFPTATDYAYSDKNHHNATHQLSYSTKKDQVGELYIGVYGSPFVSEISGGDSVAYDLVCWVSDF